MKKALRETQTLRAGYSKVRTPYARPPATDRTDYNTLRPWAAQPGVCVGGVNVPPHFWDQRGTGGYRGAVQ